MKKSILFSLLGVVAMLTACNSETTEPIVGPRIQTVDVNIVPDMGVQDRAGATADNFVMEVYTDAAHTTAANVFTGDTNKATNADGNFSMTIDRAKTYYLLCWADKKDGATSVYTTTDLKNVALTDATGATAAAEAWAGACTIPADLTNAPITITPLKRAVAKITLTETGLIAVGLPMTMTFKQLTNFNVADGKATTVATADRVVSFNTTISAPGVLKTGDLALASQGAQTTTDFSFVCDGNAAIQVAAVPLQANYNTNISGHFSSLYAVDFSVGCNDVWETTPTDSPFPKP